MQHYRKQQEGADFLRERLQKCQKLPEASEGKSGKHASVHVCVHVCANVCDRESQGCTLFVSRL